MSSYYHSTHFTCHCYLHSCIWLYGTLKCAAVSYYWLLNTFNLSLLPSSVKYVITGYTTLDWAAVSSYNLSIHFTCHYYLQSCVWLHIILHLSLDLVLWVVIRSTCIGYVGLRLAGLGSVQFWSAGLGSMAMSLWSLDWCENHYFSLLNLALRENNLLCIPRSEKKTVYS